jgi:hypothetical protein
MNGIADAILVAVCGAIPTLLVYFGSRKKQKAETEDLVASSYERLTKSLESRLEALDGVIAEQGARISGQDTIITQQNKAIAEQNATILAQTGRIAEQDKLIAEQTAKIQEQERTIVILQEQLFKAQRGLNGKVA